MEPGRASYVAGRLHLVGGSQGLKSGRKLVLTKGAARMEKCKV